MAGFSGGGGGGGSTSSTGGNLIVADDAEAATLTALKKGNTVRILASGTPAEVRWWQILADAANFATATKVRLATREDNLDARTVVEVANQAARLSLTDSYDPFRVVRQLDTGVSWLQLANPAADERNWMRVADTSFYVLYDGVDRLLDGPDILISE